MLIWMQNTSIGPTEVTSNACIVFQPPASPSDPAFMGDPTVLGATSHRNSDGFSEIKIAKAQPWVLGTSVPKGSFDIVQTIAHEFGHAILLDHSSVLDAVSGSKPLMTPYQDDGKSHRKAEADDAVGAHISLHRITQQVTGINAADAAPDGSIWALDNNLGSKGFGIWNNVGGTWHQMLDGSQALSIAVDGSGVVWHANADGNVWKRSAPGEGGSWVNVPVPVPLLAIAGGGNSTTGPVVWALSSLVTRGQLDHDVFKFNFSTGRFVQSVGAAARALTVNAAGQMFHVNEAGQMWASTPSGGWTQFRATSSDPAWSEVHAGKDSMSHLFALDLSGHGYVLNFQAGAGGPNGSEIPGEQRWAPFDQNGRYRTLFTDKNAQVWGVINTNLWMAR